MEDGHKDDAGDTNVRKVEHKHDLSLVEDEMSSVEVVKITKDLEIEDMGDFSSCGVAVAHRYEN